ncbi:hypothetical protein Patl1_14089 [Pistacia atlantica]|uniref:Uncharacterized protein n=1 Tax=Pistacia atlantica TaxID=434234 RepID=A0ACC1AW96_9ROSI|nr:hypothetical protein Patl1_14089 [Pistacia atlantica]
MWFPFWRSRDRFSLEELRYLTDQLQKVQIVNQVNKDFVIEALRSIAELLTYGDQHDSAFFDYEMVIMCRFFMEKQVMGEFVRILKVSRTVTVSLQLLQTMSIMIQNLKNEHAIYYMFSNEHINYLITYSFDFRNEELLSYYISFLRATSGKLNKNTISLLVKTQNLRSDHIVFLVKTVEYLAGIAEEVVSFPLYTEAIRFAFHEENMVRTAVLGDESVNRYITSAPHADYFSNLISFFGKQCNGLNKLVSQSLKNPSPDSTSIILAAVDEIEDNLYYFSDIISAGIPDVGKLITDHMLQLLILPLLLPSLRINAVDENGIGAVTCLYLLCCILRIVKIRDLSNMIAAALFCSPEAYIQNFETKQNGYMPGHDFVGERQQQDNNCQTEVDTEDAIKKNNFSCSDLTLREALLSYITSGDDVHVLGSLSVLATLLQTKELDESMLDALGILPQRKQHKKLLLEALVGEVSGEEQLFSSESNMLRDGINSELDGYVLKMKEQYGVLHSSLNLGTSPRVNRQQVLDALVSLFCRSNISAETLWDGGWLLRQLLPYSEAEFNSHHLKLLKDSYKNCTSGLLKEIRGAWSDLIMTVLCNEWKKCKRVIEASSPQKEPKCILMPSQKSSFEDNIPGESSFTAGERLCELVKVFVLLLQLQIFSLGRALPDQPPIYPPFDVPENSRARNAGVDISGPKPGTELKIG